MFIHKLLSLALCLASAGCVNSANAQQTKGTKTEEALRAKIKCKDFKKIRMTLGLVVRMRKLVPTLFPTTPLTLVGLALAKQIWPPF
jgi:hypothetical protein